MNPAQSIAKTDSEKGVEYIPYGAADKIRLNVRIIQNLIAVPTRSGKTCEERDALKFLMLCQAQRLNPFAGDAFLVGYDGKDGPTFSLITAHQAFLKRAETCADFEGMESGVILQGDDGEVTEREGDFHLESESVVGGWARVHRKGRRDTYRRIRLARFNSGFAQWGKDPAGMIVKCAEADALRSTFPTLLGGLYMQGEVDGGAGRIVADMVTTKPIFEEKSIPKREIKPTVASDDDGDLGPVKAAEPAPQANGGDPEIIPQLKLALKASKIAEADLMDYLRKSGRLDESIGSLDEAWMVAETSVRKIYDDWGTIKAELKKEKAGK